MSGPRIRVGAPSVVVALALALVLAGCGGAGRDGPNAVYEAMDARQRAAQETPAAPSASQSAPATPQTCSPGPEVSFAPSGLPAPGKMPSGTLMAEIARRGYLVVGVSGDTRLLGARDSLRGGELSGFDIEIAKAVARAIFGRDDSSVLRFRVITAAERIPLVSQGVAKGGVDLVARAMTMTCSRWEEVAFSAVYFKADQIMLVRSDSTADTTAELAQAKARVCAPTGSTSLERLKTISGIRPVAQAVHSDCLALWQQGKVDAITGDDAILAGFKDQDPRARLGTEKLGAEPYGLAIAKDRPEFVRFVNAVLASPAGKAAWVEAYRGSGLAAALGPKTQPAPTYGRS